MDVGEADGRTDEVKNKCEDMTKKVTTRLEASRKRYKMNNQVVNSNHEFNTRFDNHNVFPSIIGEKLKTIFNY